MDSHVTDGVVIAGRYRLGTRLGRGGMADVFDALDERLARPVAVKVLRPDLGINQDLRHRFEAEARAAARLSHPNLVAVYDTGEDAGRAYIVMERLPGETVADRFLAGPVDQAWLRRVSAEVLAALAAAHAAGIVHRDVKPGNILLSDDGRAKVADFGIAKTTEALGEPGGESGRDQTATGVVIGTPAYLAPERIDGSPATVRSDLYSVGVVMYEGLTGKKPFDGSTPLAVAYQARHEVPLDPRWLRPDADPTLVAVIGRALARDPAARFDSARAMAAALAGPVPWRTAAGPTGTQVMPVLPAGFPGLPNRRPVPIRQRRRWPRQVAATAVAAAVAALVLFALASNGDRSPTTSSATTTRPSPSTTAGRPSTTAPTVVVASDPVGSQLRSLAGQLGPADGSRAGALAGGLLQVAGIPAGQARANAATTLLSRATIWQQRKQLTQTVYDEALSLLQQAGGTVKPTDHNGGGSGGGN